MQNPMITCKTLASPCALTISVDKSELNAAFDEYWDKVKDIIPQDILSKASKGGFRTAKRSRIVKVAGGPSVFYRQALVNIISKYLQDNELQPLVYEDISVITSNGCNISAIVFMEPTVSWKGKVPGIDVELVITMPDQPDNLVELMVNSTVKQAQAKNAILVADSAPVHEGHVIVLDCQTTIDGIVWQPGTFNNNKWLVHGSVIKEPAILQHLIDMNVGESKTFTVTLNDQFGDVSGKVATLTVRINEILLVQEPKVDDDLAVSEGKKDMQSWKDELSLQYTNSLAEERNAAIYNQATMQLLEAADVGPIPQDWLSSKAIDLYNQYRRMANTEQDLIKHFSGYTTSHGKSVSCKEDLLMVLADHAGATLTTDLVLRSWGRLKGVPGNASLPNIAAYVESVKAELLKNVTIAKTKTDGGN